MEDSGSFDLGSNPGGVTRKPVNRLINRLLQLFALDFTSILGVLQHSIIVNFFLFGGIPLIVVINISKT